MYSQSALLCEYSIQVPHTHLHLECMKTYSPSRAVSHPLPTSRSAHDSECRLAAIENTITADGKEPLRIGRELIVSTPEVPLPVAARRLRHLAVFAARTSDPRRVFTEVE